MMKIKLFLIYFLLNFIPAFSQDEASPVSQVVHIFKFNAGSLLLQNLNVSYERFDGVRKGWEFGVSKYFPSNIDDALGPYIMNVHYKGYGFDICRKQYKMVKHTGFYYGCKFTFKYKYFDHEHVLVNGKAEESDGQGYTVASNKKLAGSICITGGILSGRHFFTDLYAAIGISVISNTTENYYSYNPGSYWHQVPLTEIPRSNLMYVYPEFQFGFKLGPGFRKKK
jgi:hypothetical protein